MFHVAHVAILFIFWGATLRVEFTVAKILEWFDNLRR